MHTHECRDCGSEIYCYDPDDACKWAGGNDGCDCASFRSIRDLPTELVNYVTAERWPYVPYGQDAPDEPYRPEPGGRWYWSDTKPAEATEATHAVLRPTGHDDYSGGALEASNYRSIMRDYPGVFTEVIGDMGSRSLMIALDYRPAADSTREALETLDAMVSDLAALADYPAYDDEDMSNLESEWTHAAISDYLVRDMVHELSRADREAEADALDATDIDTVRGYVYEFYSDASEYPYAETVGSIVFPGSDARTGGVSKLTEHVIGLVLEAWAKDIDASMIVNGQEQLS